MLRLRLGLLVVLTVFAALLAFGVLVQFSFVRFQDRALRQLLALDLERVQRLAAGASIGVPFLSDPAGEFTLQFVASDGRVQLPLDAAFTLPLASEPVVDRSGEHPRLVAALPWVLPSGTVAGTIRLALDLEEAFAARNTLLQSLLLSGLIIALLAALASLVLVRRALAPLAKLAGQAAGIDPAHPNIAAYQGPDDEVAVLARALDESLAAIRRRQQAERDALAEVAHELAAPLSVVAGQLDALAGTEADPRYLAARDAARELLYTSQDLLTLARGELERPLELRAVSLTRTASQVVAQYEGVRFVADGAGEVLGDPERLGQVVRNLVRNALQASARAEEVEVAVRDGGYEVHLEVQDRGPGLDADQQARIFDRYYSRRPRGHGIGLTVVKAIVERHEGRIGIRSVVGQGSCFTVTLPALEAQLES